MKTCSASMIQEDLISVYEKKKHVVAIELYTNGQFM